MNKHGDLETPPALPPKLYKLKRKESQNSSSPSRPLLSNGVSHARRSSKRPSVQSQPPVNRENGFSTILSLTESDLKGKPRDELVLMLLHLNHEKANLLRWREYFNEQIMHFLSLAETDPKAGQEADNLRLELEDIESQLKACTPIIIFLNKKLRMNDVYGGDDNFPGSSDYERPSRSLARRKSIEFLRRQEEREVARFLEAELHRESTEIVGGNYGVVTAAQMLERRRQRHSSAESSRSIRLQDYPEEPAFRDRRLQLETELEQLDELWKEVCEYKPLVSPPTPKTVSSSSRRQKSTVSKRVANRRQDFSEVTRPRSACEVGSLAYVPRRSTRRLHRSDLSSSFSADLDRRPTRSQSQSSLRDRQGAESPQGHPISGFVFSTTSEKQKQRRASSNSRVTTAKQTPASVSSFLMEPTQSIQSRWKVSMDEEDGSLSNSAFSLSPPPTLPPPPIPVQRKSSFSTKSHSQLNRWRSFGDNLTEVDPHMKPQPRGSRNSEKRKKSYRWLKSPTSDSNQSTLLERGGDLTPVPSEDPYEETPFVDSQYLTPRNSSAGVNRRDLQEQPLAPSSITPAVEYIPGETNNDTTEGTTTTTQTYPPNLIGLPINLRTLALPKPMYPPSDYQKKKKKPLTLPTSVFSAFRVPDKNAKFYRTQSAV
ncbi:hypothetical protein Aperf_G00000059707 [Anoplocephala perfoliata]